MAIKGKSKSRGARSVSRGPKPVYVPVTTPWFRRRGFWIAVAVVLGVGAVGGLWYGFAKQAREDRERQTQQRQAAAMAEYQRPIETALAPVGQPLPPTGFQAFPDLAGALDPLEDGRRAEAAATTAEAVQEAAAAAADAIDGIDLGAIVEGKDLERLFVVYLFSSKDGMVEGLQLYRQAASLVALAATADQQDRPGLVSTARDVLELADRVFARGYADYVEAQVMAGTLRPLGPGAGLPTVPTGPTG